MALIFYLSSRSDVPRLTAIKGEDLLLHIIEYGVLGFLLARAFFNSGVARWVLCAFLVGVFYGVTDELHQSFVPGRNASVLDVIADGIGSFLGASLFGRFNIRIWSLVFKKHEESAEINIRR